LGSIVVSAPNPFWGKRNFHPLVGKVFFFKQNDKKNDKAAKSQKGKK
jgi:hypothetical protein